MAGTRELTGDYALADGSEGAIARLYMAVFIRQPDDSGHAYWVDRAEAGLSLRDAARYFIDSPEFVELYDELDNPSFIDLLYRNVLDREGENGGTRFWNEQIDNGMSRATVVLLFSESPEFKALTVSS